MWLPSDESLRLLLAQIVLTGEPGNKMLAILSDSEVSNWDLRNAEITEWWKWFTGEALEAQGTPDPRVKTLRRRPKGPGGEIADAERDIGRQADGPAT